MMNVRLLYIMNGLTVFFSICSVFVVTEYLLQREKKEHTKEIHQIMAKYDQLLVKHDMLEKKYDELAAKIQNLEEKCVSKKEEESVKVQAENDYYLENESIVLCDDLCEMKKEQDTAQITSCNTQIIRKKSSNILNDIAEIEYWTSATKRFVFG